MGVAPATRPSGRGTTWRCHLGGCTPATRAVGGSAAILGGNRTALGWQLITQADMFMWRRLLPWRTGRLVLSAESQSRYLSPPLPNCPPSAGSAASHWLPDDLSPGEPGGRLLGLQLGERGLTYLSSEGRMIETHGPANCAFCLKSYYSACPVQKTKGSYEEAVVSSARHREALVLPPSGHPQAVPTPSCLAKGLSANHPLASRQGGKLAPSPQACWLGNSPQEMQWCWPVWVLSSRCWREKHSSQESQTAAPDTEGRHAPPNPGKEQDE